jgi:(1->4)-alpha-D-glucan 1-alpha-D-glucosylmutase
VAIADFAERLMLPGAINALSQTFLRLTTPGIPDFYQSALLWDETLVDPDNRRTPDFVALGAMSGGAGVQLADWRSGAIKYLISERVLHHRRHTPETFADGDYIPVEVRGPRADNVVAFVRVHERRTLLAAAIRLPGSLVGDRCRPTIQAEMWEGTTLTLPKPACLRLADAHELLTSRDLAAITPTALFAQLPVALVSVG